MSIVKEVEKIITNEDQFLKDDKPMLKKASDRYNEMVSRGIIKPRGNRVMTTAQSYSQNIAFNQATK